MYSKFGNPAFPPSANYSVSLKDHISPKIMWIENKTGIQLKAKNNAFYLLYVIQVQMH